MQEDLLRALVKNSEEDILGIRVILSYGMPIWEEGVPGHLPKPDAVTRGYVLGNDRKEREFTLPWNLDEFSLVIPKELEPFRKDALIQKGTRRVLYEPTGALLHKRLSVILDSRGKVREIDFRGGLRINPGARTITVLLSGGTEHKAGEQQAGEAWGSG